MIAIIDYGMGNLRSVQKAFEKVGAETIVTQDAQVILNAQKVVLPGVGAMQPAMEKLKSLNLINAIHNTVDQGKPFLGICLGLQLLFEKSVEGGDIKGLGILEGRVEKFSANRTAEIKVPHMGWNQLTLVDNQCPFFNRINDATYVYFCHSYYVVPKDPQIIAATTQYDIDFTSAICKNNIFGVQFHPEKSQITGLRMLENFVKLRDNG